MSIDLGLITGIIKSETEPTEKSVVWGKILNIAFPNITELHIFNHALSSWKPLEKRPLKYPVQQVGLDTPPVSPSEGDAYIIGASPTGVWSGKEKNHVVYLGGDWIFTVPLDGEQSTLITGVSVDIYHYNQSVGSGEWVKFGPLPSISGNANEMFVSDGSGNIVATDEIVKDGNAIKIKNKLKIPTDKKLVFNDAEDYEYRYNSVDSRLELYNNDLGGIVSWWSGFVNFFTFLRTRGFVFEDALTSRQITFNQSLPSSYNVAFPDKPSLSNETFVMQSDLIYGSQQYYFESEAESTTTSTTYQNKINETTPILLAGNYDFEYCFELAQTNAGDAAEALVQINGVTVAESIIEPKDVRNWYLQSGFKRLNLPADSTVDVAIVYRQQRGSTAKIRRARVKATKVSN